MTGMADFHLLSNACQQGASESFLTASAVTYYLGGMSFIFDGRHFHPVANNV